MIDLSKNVPFIQAICLHLRAVIKKVEHMPLIYGKATSNSLYQNISRDLRNVHFNY